MKIAITALLLTVFITGAQAQSASTIPASHLIEPAELVQLLHTSHPLVLQVGPRTLYAQAHVPGAEFVGTTSLPQGIEALRRRVDKLGKAALIVLYCGCCPWENCPNVAPGYNELSALGFSNVKVMHIARNFGTDWVNKGYPTEKGEAAAVPLK